MGLTEESTGADQVLSKEQQGCPGAGARREEAHTQRAAPQAGRKAERALGGEGRQSRLSNGVGRGIVASIALIVCGVAAFSAPVKKPVKTPAAPSSSDRAIAARWIATLTPRERAAQLIVIPFTGHPMNTRTREYRRFVHLVAQEHVGGLILINVANGRLSARADPLEVASFVNRMQKLAKVPLVVSGDFERGASMRVDDTTVFPHAMAFTAARDPEEARKEGAITAEEARAIGVHWLFFPDADVNNNPDNPIINIRSYGEDPKDVSDYVSAFIEGAHSVAAARVLVTAKHFPGHGDTATDTHLNLATISGDKPRLEEVEWAPFRAAIHAGVDAIMSAHIAVPALRTIPPCPPRFRPKFLTGILRGEMEFKGLIVTDALDAGGIAQGFSSSEAPVRALRSGRRTCC